MTQPPFFFDRTHMRPGSRICVAISGGADSVALLCALHAANALRHNALGVVLSAAHVHHNLRGPDADADAAFVQSLCERLQIPLTIHHVDTPRHRALTGETTEESARTLRYEVFHALLASGASDDLLTAHTLDDQAETVLMKLLRGAWTEGLSGIHPILLHPQAPGRRILRPLLATTRANILLYLESLAQPWREDASNADPSHTRNRLRHNILPVLRQENPSLDRTLANLAELAREEEEHWQHDLARLLPQILLPGTPVRGGGRAVSTQPATTSVALEVDRLRALDSPTRRRVLRAAARTLASNPGGEAIRLSFEETNRLLALCGLHPDPTVPSRTGATLRLSQNLTAKRSPRELRLSVDSSAIPAKSASER